METGKTVQNRTSPFEPVKTFCLVPRRKRGFPTTGFGPVWIFIGRSYIFIGDSALIDRSAINQVLPSSLPGEHMHTHPHVHVDTKRRSGLHKYTHVHSYLLSTFASFLFPFLSFSSFPRSLVLFLLFLLSLYAYIFSAFAFSLSLIVS